MSKLEEDIRQGSLGDKSLVINLVASLALMIQASNDCGELNSSGVYGGCGSHDWVAHNIAYAVAVAVVSLVCIIILVVLRKKSPESHDKTRVIFGTFMAVWWIVGAGVLTFDNPYKDVGNGYFAAWAGCISACVYFHENCNFFASKAQSALAMPMANMPLFLLFLAAIIESFAAINNCKDYCQEEQGFSLAVGLITVISCLIIFIWQAMPPIVLKFFTWLMILLWIPGVYVNTVEIDPPLFRTLGNGYFATWGCFFLAVLFSYTVVVEEPKRQAEKAAQQSDVAHGSRGSVETL